jgi:2-polyprenyl-3-methyl-5-hydroxy-6-metoxy-1,4-benzoquinol methylase
MQDYQLYFEENKLLWNKRTAVHKDSAFYDVPAFLGGKSSLNEIELRGLGDVKGKKVLHLQCHFGMDTLSLARMGAKVTGIDLSDASIEEAKKLNKELGLDAKFICCNVYDLREHLNETFDIVFTSYGVIGWLPDLDKWAELTAHYLKPGGMFFMAEFHPVVWMLDEDFKSVKYYYHNQEMIVVNSEGTYTDRTAEIDHKEYSWNHGLAEVLNSLIAHGLQLKSFDEFSYSPYPCFNNLVQGADGNWRVKEMEDKIPMVYAVTAVKL